VRGPVFDVLCFPDHFSALADWPEPPTDANAGTRIVDSALYWLAYQHFGRRRRGARRNA
jgi:hypothetical protein